MTAATGQPRPRRRDAGENLDALLDAAARVLADDPAATITEIAAAAGLGRVTAWRHLGSREELLALLHDRARTEIRTTLAALVSDDAPATPDHIGRAVEALAAIGSRYRILFVAQPGGELRQGRRKALAPLTAAIRRGQKAGALRTDIAPELASALVAGVARAAIEQATEDSRSSRRAVAGARRFASAGLTPPGR